jgi:uncharacterized membrane protein YphA (DoxX/SURF4 family)
MKINIPNKIQKIIVEACRILLGCVFIFSGFVKAVDPWGGAYKIEEYLSSFSLDSFNSFAVAGSFFQLIGEFALGVFLLAGIYRKVSSLLILLIMCVMTPLTLYLAIMNPVTDCGCFGDALILTNWQTFFKNIPLLIASIFIFLKHKQITFLFSTKSRSIVAVYTLLFIAGISVYCYINLPILDFRPYKTGNNIRNLMEIPEDAEADVYKTILVYEKNGIRQNYTLNDYPKGDTTWTYIETINTLIKKGYEPPIHDFTITDEDGDDITDEILSDKSYTFLLIAHKLEKASDSHINKINEIYDYAKQNGYCFICLTSSLPQQITEWKTSTGAEYPFCTTDDVTLKTIIRSNPGLMLIHNAVVVNKWADRQIPDDVAAPLSESIWGNPPVNQDAKNIVQLSLVLIIPLLLLFILDFFWYRKET